MVDEVANAEERSVTAMNALRAHFRLNDEGEFELAGDGEESLSDSGPDDYREPETFAKLWTKKDASLAKTGRTKRVHQGSYLGPRGSHRHADQRC
jgi:hypothetical protein